VVLTGLPGVGKTSLARALATAMPVLFMRIDAVEQAMRNAGIEAVGTSGYAVANAIAAENLALGHDVIADCVNPIAASREMWRVTAAAAGAGLREIFVVCSDAAEHRRRVENRKPDLAGHRLPSWDDVTDMVFEPAPMALRIDTAGIDTAALIAPLLRQLR